MNANKKLPAQIVSNVGFYLICHELSKLGWIVAISTTKLKDRKILINSPGSKSQISVVVRTVSKRHAIGCTEKGFTGDYLVIVRGIENPEFFVSAAKTANQRIIEQKGKYWLEQKDYEEFSSDLRLIDVVY